jgi:hypothetical protein
MDAIVATLKILGVKVRTERYPEYSDTVEVFASTVGNKGCDAKESGIKFTFKHGRLTELHARAWADYDQWWDVSESASYVKAVAASEAINENIKRALTENDTGHKVQ